MGAKQALSWNHDNGKGVACLWTNAWTRFV